MIELLDLLPCSFVISQFSSLSAVTRSSVAFHQSVHLPVRTSNRQIVKSHELEMNSNCKPICRTDLFFKVTIESSYKSLQRPRLLFHFTKIQKMYKNMYTNEIYK